MRSNIEHKVLVSSCEAGHEEWFRKGTHVSWVQILPLPKHSLQGRILLLAVFLILNGYGNSTYLRELLEGFSAMLYGKST
jgi:hypothetical protein